MFIRNYSLAFILLRAFLFSPTLVGVKNFEIHCNYYCDSNKWVCFFVSLLENILKNRV